MKTFKHLLLLCALVALAACSEDALAPQSEVIPIAEGGSIDLISMVVPDIEIDDATTRSKLIDDGTELKFIWQENDAIGVVPLSGSPLHFPINAENAGKSTALFDGGDWALKANGKYAAFFPYNKEIAEKDIRTIPIDYTGQTQGNWMKYDFMATGAVQPKDGAVTFTMKRLSAILKIQVKFPSSSITHYRYATLVAEEPLFGVKGTLDLSGSEPVYTPEGLTKFINTDIGMDQAASSTGPIVFSLYFMIPPTDLSGKQLKLLFNSDSGTAKEVFITGKNYEAGKAYSINVEELSDAFIRNPNLIKAVGLGDGSTPIDAWSYKEKILQVTKIDVTGKSDPTVCDEIGFFRNLEELSCSDNGITYLDVSNNSKLTDLKCGWNRLTSLDVSNNPALKYLNCGSNQLTSLDVSNNPVLSTLYCDANQLISLDMTNNPALEYLYCFNNQLTSLDVSNSPALTLLYSSVNQLTSLDVSNNSALIKLYCDNNQLTSLNLSNNTALTYLDCYVNPLASLDVSNNTALTDLDCRRNQLTALDVSNNKNLQHLYCDYNPLTTFTVNTGAEGLNKLKTLSFDGCSNLESLYCGNRDNKGNLKSLSLLNCTKLSELNCVGNLLIDLGVAQCTNLTSLYCSSNMISGFHITKNKMLPLDNLVCGRQWANEAKTESRTLYLYYTSSNTGSLPQISNNNTNVILQLE